MAAYPFTAAERPSANASRPARPKVGDQRRKEEKAPRAVYRHDIPLPPQGLSRSPWRRGTQNSSTRVV